MTPEQMTPEQIDVIEEWQRRPFTANDVRWHNPYGHSFELQVLAPTTRRDRRIYWTWTSGFEYYDIHEKMINTTMPGDSPVIALHTRLREIIVLINEVRALRGRIVTLPERDVV